MTSIQPIGHAQSGDFGKVSGIPTEQRGVMNQSDARDFQIHCADADALAATVTEEIRGRCVPWEDRPTSEEFDAFVQSPVSEDLPVWVRESMNLRQPTAQLLLDRDDGSGGVFRRGEQPIPNRRPAGVPYPSSET